MVLKYCCNDSTHEEDEVMTRTWDFYHKEWSESPKCGKLANMLTTHIMVVKVIISIDTLCGMYIKNTNNNAIVSYPQHSGLFHAPVKVVNEHNL